MKPRQAPIGGRFDEFEHYTIKYAVIFVREAWAKHDNELQWRADPCWDDLTMWLERVEGEAAGEAKEALQMLKAGNFHEAVTFLRTVLDRGPRKEQP